MHPALFSLFSNPDRMENYLLYCFTRDISGSTSQDEHFSDLVILEPNYE